MSGIVALVNAQDEPVNSYLLKQLTAHLAFRGPDAQHCWTKGAVGLGHALLQSTTDVELVQQPYSLDKQIWITGDVRIDAREALVNKLASKGCTVNMTTDDIVLLLHCYRLWGQDCLNHILGDYSFMIWDQRDQSLFCARDPFGVAPFYYAQTNNGLILSNTLSCIQRHPHVADTLNENTLGHLFLFGMNADLNTSTFADIHQLPPAHKLVWQEGQYKLSRYFELGELNTEPLYSDDREYAEVFKTLLQQAVSDRLRTRSVASDLSGGLDSGSVSALALAQFKSTIEVPYWFRTYTLAVPAFLKSDETQYARQTADWLLCDSTVTRAGDRIDQMTKMTRPEPYNVVTSARMINLPEIAQVQGVLLTGFGADGLLLPTAYQAHQNGIRGLSFGHYAYRYLRHFGRIPELHLQKRIRKLMATKGKPQTRFELPNWLDQEFISRTHLAEQNKDYRRQFAQAPGVKGLIAGATWCKAFKINDAGETGYPVKVRHPFFDLRLIRFMPHVPPLLRRNKLLLRMSMQGYLPDTVRRRPKSGSPHNPLRIYAEHYRLPDWIEDLICNTPELRQYINTDVLWKIMNSPTLYSDFDYRKAARPLALAHWLRYHKIPPKLNL